jgi:hypothetical protein
VVDFDIFGVHRIGRDLGVGNDTERGGHVAGDDVALCWWVVV